MDDCGAKRAWMNVVLRAHSYRLDYRWVALWCLDRSPYSTNEGEVVVYVVHRNSNPLVNMDVASCPKNNEKYYCAGIAHRALGFPPDF